MKTVASGSVNSLNTIFSPNKKALNAQRNHHSFNSTYISLLTPNATNPSKPYEKPKLQQSTPLIKQISTDSILTASKSSIFLVYY